MAERKRRYYRYVVGLVLVLALTGMGFLALRQLFDTTQNDARIVHLPIPVQTVPAKVQTIDRIIGASGTIQPSYPVTMTAKVVAKVLNVPVVLGMIVRPGDLLVQLDPTLYEANVAKAQADYQHAHNDLQRQESLFKRNFASAVQIETARDADAEAYASLVSAQINLSNTRVTSPVAGFVQVRNINPGETTQVDEQLIQLGVLDPAYMEAAVSEDNIGYVYIGMPGTVGTDAYPGQTFHGTVARIDSVVQDTTRTFGAYISIANHDLRLKTGITGFARLESKRMALAVPSTAVVNPVGDHATVFVVDHGVAHIRQVRCGLASHGMTEILSGLQEGEQVVTVGQLYLQGNDKVMANAYAPWNAK
jgi:membrane fusion protein (multidrug efflux system)